MLEMRQKSSGYTLSFIKKKKIRIRGKNIDQLTFIGEITAFRVMHYIRVENNFPTIGT
jgi:hypothetical protein